MTIRIIPLKKRRFIIPESAFFRFLAISLILHGLFICVVSYNNENFRKKLMVQIRNAVPVKVIFYQPDLPEVTPVKKEVPLKNESIALKTPDMLLAGNFTRSHHRKSPTPGDKTGNPGIRNYPQSRRQSAATTLKVKRYYPQSRRQSAATTLKVKRYCPQSCGQSAATTLKVKRYCPQSCGQSAATTLKVKRYCPQSCGQSAATTLKVKRYCPQSCGQSAATTLKVKRYCPQSCGQSAATTLKVKRYCPQSCGQSAATGKKRMHFAKTPKKETKYIPLPCNISRYNGMESSTPEIKKTKTNEEARRQTPPVIRKQKTVEYAPLNKDSKSSLRKNEVPSPVPVVPAGQVVAVSAVEPVKAKPEKREEIPMPSSDSGNSDSASAYSAKAKENAASEKDKSPVSAGIPNPSKKVEGPAHPNRENGSENHTSPAANPKPAENGGAGKKGREKTGADGEEMRRRLAEFRGIVAGRIESVKVYPHEARQERQEGKVVISFIIDPTGNIGNISIVSSSGFHLLDKAASEAVEAGAPYQPFPVGLNKPVRIKMTINFKIS